MGRTPLERHLARILWFCLQFFNVVRWDPGVHVACWVLDPVSLGLARAGTADFTLLFFATLKVVIPPLAGGLL